MSDKLLDLLADNQRKAFLLQIQKHTYTDIGRLLSVPPATAKAWCMQAKRSFQEIRFLHNARLGHDQPATLSLTRGELYLLMEVLISYSYDALRRAGGYRLDSDPRSLLPYSAQVLEAIYARLYAEYYGKPADAKLF